MAVMLQLITLNLFFHVGHPQKVYHIRKNGTANVIRSFRAPLRQKL